ncbi:stage III sporulation protein AA [Thermohalobacter berrensis]|uniref:Stage III sporulation protein AA n=2 Tax=Thermohalobacter berrensis TaxID=99594 RepID=A0A419TBB8_9FIRM|nr:stage III sporulation protein AA [Thermohalobacter berrensis]
MNTNFLKKSYGNSKFQRNPTKYKEILELLDSDIAKIMDKIPKRVKDKVEEIRLRIGRPLMICLEGSDYFLDKRGKLNERDRDSYIVTEENIKKTFRLLCNYSVYAVEDDIKRGFITIKGGHRIGITGKTVYGEKGIEIIKEIASLNIRIAREKVGISNKVIKYIIKKPNSIYNTLIVSPPQCGKTTLLRDLVRNISTGVPKLNFRGLKVGVVDERSEIGGVFKGVPQNDLGPRTDILDGCKKHDGIMILIRAMSPYVIATDEIGDKKDIKAIHESLKAGVKIIATVHGENINDIKTKPNLRQIINEKIFKRIIILDNSKGVGTIKDILDGNNFKSILDGDFKYAVYTKNNWQSHDCNIM